MAVALNPSGRTRRGWNFQQHWIIWLESFDFVDFPNGNYRFDLSNSCHESTGFECKGGTNKTMLGFIKVSCLWNHLFCCVEEVTPFFLEHMRHHKKAQEHTINHKSNPTKCSTRWQEVAICFAVHMTCHHYLWNWLLHETSNQSSLIYLTITLRLHLFETLHLKIN